eukprot:EG_transcript_11400
MGRLPFVLDIVALLRDFAEHWNCPELAAFREVWQQKEFGLIHLGAHKDRVFEPLLLSTSIALLTLNRDLNTQLFSLYLTYFLYETQLETPKATILISPDTFRCLRDLYQYAVKAGRPEVVQMIKALSQQDAFEYHAYVDTGHLFDYLLVSTAGRCPERPATHDSFPCPTADVATMLNPTTLHRVWEPVALQTAIDRFVTAAADAPFLMSDAAVRRAVDSLREGQLVADLRNAHTVHDGKLGAFVRAFDAAEAEENERMKARILLGKRRPEPRAKPALPQDDAASVGGDPADPVIFATTLHHRTAPTPGFGTDLPGLPLLPGLPAFEPCATTSASSAPSAVPPTSISGEALNGTLDDSFDLEAWLGEAGLAAPAPAPLAAPPAPADAPAPKQPRGKPAAKAAASARAAPAGRVPKPTGRPPKAKPAPAKPGAAKARAKGKPKAELPPFDPALWASAAVPFASLGGGPSPFDF